MAGGLGDGLHRNRPARGGSLTAGRLPSGFGHPLNWSWNSYMVCLTAVIDELGDPDAAAALYGALDSVSKQQDVLAVVRTRRAWAAMLLDRNAPGDAIRARDLIAAGRAEAEQLGMARELVRFERLEAKLAALAAS